MTLAGIAMIGALGLAVDIGRAFIAKNEMQTFCDAAALAAALKLDGTSTGITNAQSAVSSSTNTWNLNTTTITSPTVTFATSSSGPWVSSPSSGSGYMFVQVTATAPMSLYFLPVVVNQSTQNIPATAIAGQVGITTIPRGLAPYTAVTTSNVGPYFGLTVGSSYDIQWPQFNNTRAGCSPSTPDKCFNSPPCSGESFASKAAVVNAWSTSNNGYWGASANSTIAAEILDLIQLQSVAVGTNIQPVLTNGNKAAEAVYLDQRASQDVDTSDNTLTNYLSATHNGRRLIAMPIVMPNNTSDTTVVGYGQFFLLANGPGTSNYYSKGTNGNDPFCAIYAGPYTIGASGPGAGGTYGASRVTLVQ